MTQTVTIPDTDLVAFCAAIDAMIAKHFAEKLPEISHYNRPTEFERGKKFARIVRVDVSSRSAFCFVDLTTGDILKTAGWKAPAKGVRGHIRNGSADLTPYGAHYFRR